MLQQRTLRTNKKQPKKDDSATTMPRMQNKQDPKMTTAGSYLQIESPFSITSTNSRPAYHDQEASSNAFEALRLRSAPKTSTLIPKVQNAVNLSDARYPYN